MKLGIMQPYFFPYIGYWQLLNYVDKYVIYDDVNYIKGGWINRNRILSNGQPVYFTLNTIGASPNKLINEVQVNTNEKMINKSLKTIRGVYQKAPFFNEVFPLIEDILLYKEENLALYIKNSFEMIAKYLDIQTEFIISSNIYKNNSLRGQDKVINICERLNASTYVNAIGGQDLYSFEEFEIHNIELNFLKTNVICYDQFKNDFVGNLSIIDVLMFNSKESIKKYLNEFELIKGDE